MKNRASTIIGWICTILVAAFNIFAGVMKFMPIDPGSEADVMMQRLGITGSMHYALGVLELAIVVLFLIPRTSTVGLVLMVGYLGGALATNLTHGFSHMEALPIYISFVLIAVSALTRNPELFTRIKGRKVQA